MIEKNWSHHFLLLLLLLSYVSLSAQTDWPSWWQEVQELQDKRNLQSEDLAEQYPALEKQMLQLTDPLHRAVAQMIMAGLYTHFYLEHQFQIRERTHIPGYVPSDLREWSKNEFSIRIRELMHLSENQIILLKNSPALDFNEILEISADTLSIDITPTVYEVFLYQKKSFLMHFDDRDQILEILQQLIDFRKQELHLPALISAELALNDFRQASNPIDFGAMILRLDSLEMLYHHYPEVVEILHAKAKAYLNDTQKGGHKRIAYRICEEGIRKFPDYPRIHLLSNLLNDISTKSIQVEGPAVVRPHLPFTLEVTTQNVPTLIVRRYAILAEAARYRLHLENQRISDGPFQERQLVDSQIVHIPFHPDFDAVTSTIAFTAGNFGIYEYECIPENSAFGTKSAGGYYIVSDLAYFRRTLDNGSSQYYVVDRSTGHPVHNVEIQMKTIRWHQDHYREELMTRGTTSRKGECTLMPNPNEYRQLLYFSKGKDAYQFASNWGLYHRQHPQKSSDMVVDFFTDRSIYRPGQTIHFKAIAYYPKENAAMAAEEHTLEVYLYGSNGQELSVKTITTNEFGSAAGTFQLPADAMNGHFSIRTKSMGSIHFKVEEYRLPGFEIKVADTTEELHFGQPVSIEGRVRAYAGYSLSDAHVSYVITRIKHPRMRHPFVQFSKQIASGETRTNAAGGYQIKFTPQKELTGDEMTLEAYRYQIELTVTDASGETQQQNHSLFVGDRSVYIQAEVPELTERSSRLSIAISTLTLNNIFLERTIDYQVQLMKLNTEFYEQITEEKAPETLKVVLTGRINSTDKTLNINTSKWENGFYRLILTTHDSRGQKISEEYPFVVYDQKERRPPLPVQAWLPQSEITALPGEKVSFNFGSSYKNIRVLYEILQGDSVLSAKWIRMNGKIRTFIIPFKESYSAGIVVHFTFVKDEQLVRKQVTVRPKIPEQQLTPRFSVFRDKLLPGATEQWTISIPEVKKSGKPAELLLSIYDASLDQIEPHRWHFTPIRPPYFPYSSMVSTTMGERQMHSEQYRRQDQRIPDFSRRYLKLGELHLGYGWHGPFIRHSVADNLMVRGMKMSVSSDVQLEEEIAESVSVDLVDDYNPAPQVQYRHRFSEMAYFDAQLKTDSLGEAHFSFTMPEQLTRWNLKLMAHNAQLKSGMADTVFVTQQALTAQLHLPRFVRTSDRWMFSSTISNLSDETLSITVQPSVTDSKNEQSLLPVSTQKVIVLAAGTSETLSWETAPSEDAGWLLCRISAAAVTADGLFTDGEQKELAVLTDKVLITESLPFLLRGQQQSSVSMEELKWAAQHQNLQAVKLEFSANPMGYALQALPVMATPASESSMDYFSAWYAHAKLQQMMEQHPNIRTMMQEWMAEENDASQNSPLERNPELKNVLLEATPWVVQAAEETSGNKRWKEFLQNNETGEQLEHYWQKLSDRQLPSGGFPWQLGMSENRWMTQWILLKMTGITIGKKQEAQQVLILKGLKYLDGCIVKDYLETTQKIKKYTETRTITPLQLQYLVLRSMYRDIAMSPATYTAFNYYLTQTLQYHHKMTRYEKAMATVFLARIEQEEQANKLLKSLIQESVQTADRGIYWPSRRAGPFWHDRPIGMHVALMEAFSAVPGYDKQLGEMRLWLLLQKQTQRWEDPVSTLEAVHLLLRQNGSEWSESTYQLYTGDTLLATTEGRSGVGYIAKSLDANQLTKGLTLQRTPEVDRKMFSPATIAWGAVYWQTLQPMAEVKSSGSGMTITKQLFIKRMTTDQQSILIPVGPDAFGATQTILSSDRVVSRIVLTTDREFEFVSLRDEKPAALEAVVKTSGMSWREGVVYYRTPKDSSTQYFFGYLPKGYYVFEEEYFVHTSGQFTGGIVSVQCLYAPEFTATSASERITIQ